MEDNNKKKIDWVALETPQRDKMEKLLGNEDFKEFANSIAAVETSGKNPYTAKNSTSSATGKYQFLTHSPSVRVWEKRAGMKGPQDWVITPADSPETRAKKEKNQELLLAAAYSRDYLPRYKKIQKGYGSDLSKHDAMALIHFKGQSAAQEWADTGIDPTPGTKEKPNLSIKEYLERARKGKGSSTDTLKKLRNQGSSWLSGLEKTEDNFNQKVHTSYPKSSTEEPPPETDDVGKGFVSSQSSQSVKPSPTTLDEEYTDPTLDSSFDPLAPIA